MLSDIPLFAGLTDEEQAHLDQKSVIRSIPAGSIVISRGDRTNALYLILSGRVDVFIANDQGKEIIVNTLEAGDYFGELALLGNITRTASVKTTEDSEFQIIGHDDFSQCLADHPDLALNLIRSLVERITALTDNVSSLALLDVYQRVVAVLYQNANDDNGVLRTGRLTQQDIANRIGASREMVSRILNDLKAGGYISIEQKSVSLLKKLPTHW